MSALAEAALAYAECGWPVFPLAPCSKVPLLSKDQGGNGVHDATTDRQVIARWWAARPDGNVGLAAGSHWWVLDVDYGGWDARELDGADTMRALQERFGRLPATVTSCTGGGGWQYLFAPDNTVKNGVRVLPGLDTRSTGGYVVASPSAHPSGRTYRWRRGHGPYDLPIAAAPAWLVALLAPVESPAALRPTPTRITNASRYAEAALDRACAAIATAPIGAQCDTLDRQAYGIGRLVAGGALPRGHALDHVVAAGCRMTNDPRQRPWTLIEIEARIERAFRQAAHHPREAG